MQWLWPFSFLISPQIIIFFSNFSVFILLHAMIIIHHTKFSNLNFPFQRSRKRKMKFIFFWCFSISTTVKYIHRILCELNLRFEYGNQRKIYQFPSSMAYNEQHAVYSEFVSLSQLLCCFVFWNFEAEINCLFVCYCSWHNTRTLNNVHHSDCEFDIFSFSNLQLQLFFSLLWEKSGAKKSCLCGQWLCCPLKRLRCNGNEAKFILLQELGSPKWAQCELFITIYWILCSFCLVQWLKWVNLLAN